MENRRCLPAAFCPEYLVRLRMINRTFANVTIVQDEIQVLMKYFGTRVFLYIPDPLKRFTTLAAS